MRPPDNLSTLKNFPLVMLAGGLFLTPFMWLFVIRPGTALAIAPVTGLIYFLVGVHIKYRSRYSPREALWAFPLAISFFGSMVVMSTTALVWRMGRMDLVGWALGLAAVLCLGGMAAGYWFERRRLAKRSSDGIPEVLVPWLDLQRHRVRPLPAEGAPPTMGRMAFLAALTLNVPLLLQLNGWDRNDIVWLAMPVLGATVTYVLATGFGPALARAMAVLALERRLGHRFCTSRIEELMELRRGFRLSRWLMRPEDFASVTASPASGARKRGRR